MIAPPVRPRNRAPCPIYPHANRITLGRDRLKNTRIRLTEREVYSKFPFSRSTRLVISRD